MAYTLGQAANAAGKAKSTIFKACKDGLISSSRDDRGPFLIDPAELHRVFPPPPSIEHATERADEQPRMDEERVKAFVERDFLKREVEQLRTLLDDMKGERDEWRRQAQTLSLAAPVVTPAPAPEAPEARAATRPMTVPSYTPPAPRSWWPWRRAG
jgi:hypothetical protein